MDNYGKNDFLSEALSKITFYPEPIKSWVYSVVMNAWQLIAYNSQIYINDMWKKNILPQYVAQFSDRYPFLATSNLDVSLDNFKNFFAPKEFTSFEMEVKSSFEDELADAIIRLLDLAGYKNIDIQKHIDLKLQYNKTRPHKHGKSY